MRPKENDFRPATRTTIAKMAGFICSKPGCDKGTVGPDQSGVGAIDLGKAAHIHGASPNGPRFRAEMTADEISSAENGVWLCAIHADEIDKNDGRDHPADLLRAWKHQREQEAANALSQRDRNLVAGSISARGIGEVTGLHVRQRSVKFEPGTTIEAEGVGKIKGVIIE